MARVAVLIILIIGLVNTDANQPSKGGVTEPTKDGSATWDKTGFSKEDLEKLDGAFDSDATTSFNGTDMFDPRTGKMSDDLKTALDDDERSTVEDIETTWSNVIDMNEAFGDALPEDVQFFVQKFRHMDTRKLQKIMNSPNTVTEQDLEEVSLEIIGAMNKTFVREQMSQFPNPTKDAICEFLQEEQADFDTTKKIIGALDCAAILVSKGRRPSASLAEAIAESKMDEKSPRQWTGADWSKAIQKGWFVGLPEHVIERCPSRVIRDNMGLLSKMMMDMDDRLKEKVMAKMQSDFGGFDRMSSDDLKFMGDMVTDMSLKEMKNLNGSAVRESLDTFRQNIAGMSAVQKLQVRRAMKEEVGQGRSWSTGDVVDSAAFIGRDRNLMKTIDKDAVIANISGIGQQDMDKKSARSFMQKIREDANYDQATDFDTAGFRELGKIATGLSPRFMKDMANVNFSQLLESGDLENMEFDKESARALIDKVKSDGSKASLSQSDLEKLGKNVQGLKKEDVENITADDLAAALESMKDTFNEIMETMDTPAVDTMINKLEEGTGGLAANLEKMGTLLRKLPVKKLKNLTDEDLGDMSGRTARDFNCSEVTCPELYQRVVNKIGQPGVKNPNMTLGVFKNLGRVMCGMSLDDLKKLPATSSLEGITANFIELGCLSDKQERILAEKIKYRMGLFGDEVKTISRNDIKKFGALLKHFTSDELKSFGSSQCEDIALEIGTTDLANVMKDDLKKLTKFALDCMNKTNGALSSDDMTTLGDLSCGLEKERVDDIDSDAMEDAVYNVQKKCAQMDSTERKVWAEKAMKKLNVTESDIENVDEVTLGQFGSLLGELSASIISKIPDETMSSIGADLVEQFAERNERLEERDEAGYGGDVTTGERKDREQKEIKFNEQLVDAFINTADSSRRRRRSTGTLTCDDMQLLGSGVTAMTAAQISAMADDDFLDCASFLGSQTGWDADQLDALLTVSIRSNTYGSSSGWTADHVYSVGVIAQSLSTSEITALTDLNIDAMYSIGRHEGWSVTQLSSGFSRWLNLNKGDDASTVTSTELVSLGHFACGATNAHISDMSSTVYSYASSYIGELTSCDESQMTAFTDHAIIAFGALSTWDDSVISTVGNMIGGLTDSEISTLTDSQIATISPEAISLIPSSTFVGFSADQLSGFSVAQAQSTTSAQHAGLSQAQLDALIAAGATVESGAGVPQASLLCLLVISMTVIRNIF